MRTVFPEIHPARSFVYIWRRRVLEQAASFMIARHGLTPLPVEYERLVRERETVLAEVFQHAGVACPPGAKLSAVRRRQATGLNARWVTRLAADLAHEYPFPVPAELPAPAFT